MSTLFQDKQWPSHLECWLLIISKNHHCPNTIPGQALRKDLGMEWGGRCCNQDSPDLIYSWIRQSPGLVTKESQPPKSESIRSLSWLMAEHHPLISLMGHCFYVNEWLVENKTAQHELHASEMRQAHKSIPCLKITLLRIETETHTQACAHTALRKATMELEKSTV